jgi:hypothetical protein
MSKITEKQQNLKSCESEHGMLETEDNSKIKRLNKDDVKFKCQSVFNVTMQEQDIVNTCNYIWFCTIQNVLCQG